MSYPDPATTDWVPLWSAGPIAGYVPAARAYHSASQTVAAVPTTLALNSERFDTDGIHDTATNNSRLTCRTAGYYLITGSAEWLTAAGTYRQISVILNGVTPLARVAHPPTGGGIVTRQTITTAYYLNPGDYVELVAEADVSVTLNTAPNFSPEFEIAYLGPNVALGAVTPVAYGTTLPATPADGQEAILVDSITAPTYTWRFRYNAGSSSPYKWEFVGGAPAVTAYDASESTGSTSYVNLSGPSLVVPRAGDYHGDASATLTQGAATSFSAGIQVSALNLEALTMLNGAGVGWVGNVSGSGLGAALSAGLTVRIQYATQASTVAFSRRKLRIWPVRVS